MSKTWSGRYTLDLYRALTSEEVFILVQARTEHCGLSVCLYKAEYADGAVCQCRHSDDTVLHVLVSC